MVLHKLPICRRWAIGQKMENSFTLVVEMKVGQTSVPVSVRYLQRAQQAMPALVVKPSSILKLGHFHIGKPLLLNHRTQSSVAHLFG